MPARAAMSDPEAGPPFCNAFLANPQLAVPFLIFPFAGPPVVFCLCQLRSAHTYKSCRFIYRHGPAVSF